MASQNCWRCGQEFDKKALKKGECSRCLETVQNKRAYRDLYDRIVGVMGLEGPQPSEYPTEEEAKRITGEVLWLFE